MALENTDRTKIIKKIINGKTFNTATSDLVFHKKQLHDPIDVGSFGLYYGDDLELWRSRYGMFFIVQRDHDYRDYGEDWLFEDVVTPISEKEALKLMNENGLSADDIEFYVGEVPEAGSGEERISFRLSSQTFQKAKKLASEQKLSLNAWLNKAVKQAIIQNKLDN
jgi:hypothetical protein